MIIQDGCRPPYLSTDRNHFKVDTTRPLWTSQSSFEKSPTGGLRGDEITRKKKFTDERRDGCTADGTLTIEILPQNLIPDVRTLQVLKLVKLIFLNRLIVWCNEETRAVSFVDLTNKCSVWLCMCAHSLIIVKIKLMAGYIFLLNKSFSSHLKFCTICIVHGF